MARVPQRSAAAVLVRSHFWPKLGLYRPPDSMEAMEAPDFAKTAVFCADCQMYLNGQAQWEDHKIGKKHRLNTRAARRRERAAAAATATQVVQAAEQHKQQRRE